MRKCSNTGSALYVIAWPEATLDSQTPTAIIGVGTQSSFAWSQFRKIIEFSKVVEFINLCCCCLLSLVTLSNLLTKYPIKCYCSNPCFFLFETCLMSSFWHLNYCISHPSEIEIKKDNMKQGSPFLSFIQRDNIFSTVLLRHISIYY